MDTSEALDLSKENIQPLKKGRNPVQLGAALQAQTNSEVQHQLSKEREKYELKIRMYEGDDPLQPRYEYVAWLEQSYPRHGPESNLIPLLEDTLIMFKDDDKYKQDQRFAELLVKYIETQLNPLDLYQVVYSQGLGTMCALFYRAWAEEFDKSNDVVRADQIYQLGIKNRAQPLDLLTEAHMQFQLSVGRRTLGYKDMCSEEADAYSRETLGKLQNKKKVPSIRENSGAPGAWPLAPSNRNTNQNQKVKAPIKVYQENSDNENFTNFGGTGAGGVFPTHKAMQKENSLLPGPWSGQTHKIKQASKPTPTTPFQVHEDEGEAEGNHPQRTGAIVPRALKPRKLDTFTCPLAVFEPPDPTKQAMYCKHKVYVGGREYQFEELRAAEYFVRLEQQQQKFERESEAKPIEESVDTVENVQSRFEKEGPEEVSCKTFTSAPKEIIPEAPSEGLPKPEITEPEQIISEEIPSHHVEPETNHEVSNETNLVPEEPEPVRLIFPEKRHQPVQKFGVKHLMDANASLTANTKEAMNLVQEMWGSPSPIKAPVKHRKLYGGFLPSADKNDEDVFKVPAVPQPKVPPFTLYTDEESAATPNVIDANPSQKFSVFTDEDNVAQRNVPVVNDEEQSRPSTFPIYIDDFEKEQHPCTSYGLPGDKTRKELDHIESCDSAKPAFRSKPLLGLITEVVKPSEIPLVNRRESIYGNLNVENSGRKCLYPLQLPQENPSRQLAFNDDPVKSTSVYDKILEVPFVKGDESDDQPLANLIPDQNLHQTQNKNIPVHRESQINHRQFEQPQFNSLQVNDDTDVTCNTKAFAFALPSSTPMPGHFQSNPGSQVNMSYTVQELPQKPVVAATHQELSMILEASKERATVSSSCSSNGATQHLQNEIVQQPVQILPEEISKIEKSCGILSISGDIDPFSTEFTSQMLTHVAYPRPYHLTGIQQMDNDLPTLCSNSSVKLGSMKYILQNEIGKGAYARILKATTGNKTVALKYQKPACVWELYITQELQLRIRKRFPEMINAYMEISNAFIFRNASVFETEWVQYGSLLNVVNTVKKSMNKVIPLNIVVLISVQLISVIKHLHKCKVIHGDVKPDNFLLTAVPSLDTPKQIFIKLIDFGRSIDMSLLPERTTFTKIVTTDGFTCTEMLNKLPWTYQTDTFGLVGTIYLLLTGDYMKVVKKGKKWQLQTSLPRYCERNLWEPIFSTLLNVESCEKQANLEEFEKSLRKYVESDKKINLKQQLNTFSNILNGM